MFWISHELLAWTLQIKLMTYWKENDLSNNVNLINNIKKCNKVKKTSPDMMLSFSNIVFSQLKSFCNQKSINLMFNKNMKEEHLDLQKLDLNRKGNSVIAKNLLNFIEGSSYILFCHAFYSHWEKINSYNLAKFLLKSHIPWKRYNKIYK